MERIRTQRKSMGRIGLVFLILFVVNTASCQPIREKLQKVYTSYIGIREETGNNDGAAIERFLKVCGLTRGNPWCAATAAAVHIEAGIKAPISGYCPDWFKTNVVYRQSWKKGYIKSKPGMVFGLYFASKGRVAHMGFIDSEDANNYYTVEGNTNSAGSREGDGCYRKIRKKNSIYVIADYVPI